MATTINSGYANSPKLTANIADHADVFGGRALVFDGVADYLDCGTGLGNQLGDDYSGGLTFSMWLNVSGITTNDGIFQFHISGLECGTIFESNKIAWYLNGSKWSESSVISTGNWFNLVCVLDTSSHSNSGIYINGIKDSTGTATNFPSAGALDFSGKTFLLGKYFNDTFTYHGKMSDVKIFNTALTEAQVTELYRKPENTPSAVQDNLVAWYPMIEGNPESPQSIVYDHSEKGLGSEIVNDPSLDTDLANGATNANFKLSGVGEITGGAWSFTSGGGVGRLTVMQDASTQYTFVSGKLYKLQFTIVSSGNALLNLDFVNSSYINYENGTHTLYAVGDGGVFQIQASGSGNSFTLTDISFKEVLMGNHAQTNFFGDEIITNGTFDSDTTGWTATRNATLSSESGGQSGNYLKVLTGSSDNPEAQETVTVEASKQYYFSFYHKDINSSSDTPQYAIYDVSNSAYIQNYVNVSSAISSSSWVQQTNTFTTPSGCTSVLLILRHTGTANDSSYFGFDTVSLKEVGISSSGFETAVNEPVVPQVPLMRYNQKMFFGADHTLNQYVSTGQAFNFGKKVTISVWLVPDEIISESRTAIIGGRYYTNGDFHLGLHDNTRQIMFTPSASTGGQWNLNENEWDIGKLIHLCLVYDTSEQGDSGRDSNKLYVNGILKSTSTGSGGTVDLQTSSLNIGHTNQMEYHGFLDEVSIFNSSFTQTQVQELFNDGVALDATTSSKASALKAYWRNDGVTTWKNRGDKFASFDGVDDVIIRNAINVDYKSISLWIRPTATITTTSGTKGVAFFHAWSFGGVILGGNNTDSFDGEIIMMQENESSTAYKTAWVDHSVSIPSDSWSHIALVWDGSKYKIYFNGYSKTLVSADGGHVPLRTNKAIRIGHMGASASARFDGDMSHFAIWSESLTDAQVLSIYNAGQNGNIASIQSSDLELYYTFDPHASTDADTNASVQDRSGNDNDSTSVSGAVIDRDGSVQGSPDSITIREGLNSNRDGLGFYFTNPSSNVLRLNGVDEYLELPVSKGLQSQSALTLEAWIKCNPLTTAQGIISKDDTTNRVFNMAVLESTSGSANKVIFNIYSGGSAQGVTSTSVVADGNWHHIVGVFEPSVKQAIYIDGKLETKDTSSIPSSIDLSTDEANTPIRIGNYENNSLYFKGLLDEVKIYNRALTDGGVSVGSMADGEIKKNYKHQKGKHKND